MDNETLKYIKDNIGLWVFANNLGNGEIEIEVSLNIGPDINVSDKAIVRID
jgi:hypothetical protein